MFVLRLVLFLLPVLAAWVPRTAQAQATDSIPEFAPIGAKWWYSRGLEYWSASPPELCDSQSDPEAIMPYTCYYSYSLYECIDTVVLKQEVWKKIIRSLPQYNLELRVVDSIYMRQEGYKVYLYDKEYGKESTHSYKKLIYDFSLLPGDTVEVFRDTSSYDKHIVSGLYKVISRKNHTIENNDFAYNVLEPVSRFYREGMYTYHSNPSVLSSAAGENRIYDFIGSNGVFKPNHPLSVEEGSMDSLRCYYSPSTGLIHFFNSPTDCNSNISKTVNTLTFQSKAKPHIYHTETELHVINGLGCNLLILNGLGSQVLDRSVDSNHVIFSTGELSKGLNIFILFHPLEKDRYKVYKFFR
jgi:hypothetical protein